MSTRVVVFNDSPTVRKIIRAVISAAGDLEVVAEATDGRNAAQLIESVRPDVVIMDVVMPHVDGYEATRDIMATRPTPIVMVSSVVDPRDRSVIFSALAAGALHIAEQPPAPGSPNFQVRSAAFAELVRTVAGVQARRPPTPQQIAAAAPKELAAAGRWRCDAIGIVASAGGPQAVSALLQLIPGNDFPPILLVQHLAAGFAASYAAWLQDTTGKCVVVASDGISAERGRVYQAPDDYQLGIGDALKLIVRKDPPVGGFRPSGDYLLASMAALGQRAVGIVLSGMGRDGTRGATDLRAAGGSVGVQLRSTAAVDGMPRSVLDAGAGDVELSLAGLVTWLGGGEPT